MKIKYFNSDFTVIEADFITINGLIVLDTDNPENIVSITMIVNGRVEATYQSTHTVHLHEIMTILNPNSRFIDIDPLVNLKNGDVVNIEKSVPSVQFVFRGCYE
jgi:hypothetical protein